MPAADFHNYARRIATAARRADGDPTDAQRDALNHKVGKVYCHGLEISITNPIGSVRRGKAPDGGRTWERVVRNHYGHVNRTTSEDGEHFDVWLGAHPESQLVFTFDFLTASGEHDETKCVMAVRNLNEAKKVVADNYPDGWLDERIGEVRGYYMPQFKAWLKTSGFWKKKAGFMTLDERLELEAHEKWAADQARRRMVKKAAYWCKKCKHFYKDRSDDDGCPECDRFKESRYRDDKLKELKDWLKKTFTEEQLDGIYVMVHPDRGHCVVDCMDWGDGKISQKIVDKMHRMYGRDSVIVQNEGLLPKAGVDGWEKAAGGGLRSLLRPVVSQLHRLVKLAAPPVMMAPQSGSWNSSSPKSSTGAPAGEYKPSPLPELPGAAAVGSAVVAAPKPVSSSPAVGTSRPTPPAPAAAGADNPSPPVQAYNRAAPAVNYFGPDVGKVTMQSTLHSGVPAGDEKYYGAPTTEYLNDYSGKSDPQPIPLKPGPTGAAVRGAPGDAKELYGSVPPGAAPKPRAGADDDLPAERKLWSSPDQPWLPFVNSHAAPTGGTSMIGSNAGPERAVNEHLQTLPRGGVNNLVDYLHDPRPRSEFNNVIYNGSGGGRPLLMSEQSHTDPVAWQMYREWAGGKEFPYTGSNSNSVRQRFATDPADRAQASLMDRTNLGVFGHRERPSGLTAIHESTHVAQTGSGDAGQTPGGSGWSELVPSLNDLPYAEEHVRRLQADQQVPVIGSGLSLDLPGGTPFTAATMHQQAKDQGLFGKGTDKKTMAELLNTNAGRQWLKQRAGQ